MLTEDLHSFRGARAEISSLKPEFITEGKPQGQRRGKPLQRGLVVTQQNDFITKVVCVASTPQLDLQTATPGTKTSPFGRPTATPGVKIFPFGRPTSAVFHEVKQKPKNKTKQAFESEIFSGLAQFAEFPNAEMQAIKNEAIGGDFFPRAGAFASTTPQNNKRQSQSTTKLISFNPVMAQSLVPVTAIKQKSNHGNAIARLAPMVEAISKIMKKAGENIMKSEAVDATIDETLGFVCDIQWALGTEDFSCNFSNSDTDSDSFETLQSEFRSLERGVSGYSRKVLSSILETVEQNVNDDISNSGSSYTRSSSPHAAYACSRARPPASYARSRAAYHYANNEETSTRSHGASSNADSRGEALLKEKEALEDAIADLRAGLRAQKSLLEMNAKFNAEKELMEMNAKLKAEKESFEGSVAESACV